MDLDGQRLEGRRAGLTTDCTEPAQIGIHVARYMRAFLRRLERQAMPEAQKKIRFDGTINLGHILTVLTFCGAGAVGWNAMDKRITVLEEARVVQQQIDKRQDDDRNDMKRTVREDMREIIRKVDILVERRS
jgi:hypothetical protein